MDVRNHLMVGEVLVLEHPPFYLTSLRLLRSLDELGKEGVRGLPLEGVTAVEEVKGTRHGLMVLGATLVVSGFVMLITLGFFTSGLAIVGGIAALVIGAMGKTASYQIHARNLTPEEEGRWRLPSFGAEHFIRRVRGIIGERTGF